MENTWIYGKNKQYSTIFKENVKNSIPVISGITINNGVNYYTTDTLKDNEVFSDCLTISTRGEYSGTVTYHKGKFALANNILTMPLNDKWSEKSKLFFAALINNLGYGGYSGYPRKETLKNDIIQLPITSSGEINFDFMESFIAELEAERVRELEAERVRELEAYLKASGLSNTTLNPDEYNALNTWNSRIWQEFKIGDFFDIRNTTGLNTDKLNDGLEYDYITRTSNNQGILKTTGLVNQSNLNEAGVWSLGLLQMDFFYRKRQWYAGQFVRKIIPKIKLSKNAILFFTTLLNCQKKILLSVLVRNVDETFRNLKIQLPITANGEIDFDFMESFIKAIQKESIKGVDSYLAKNIATTKEVINN